MMPDGETNKASSRQGILWGGLAALAGLVVLFVALNPSPPPEKGPATAAAPADERPVPFDVVGSDHTAPDVDKLLVVVSPKHTSDRDLANIARQIRARYQADSLVSAIIYSDRRAAALNEKCAAGNCTSAELAFSDAHFVGMFNQNTPTKLEELIAYPHGPNDPKQHHVKL